MASLLLHFLLLLLLFSPPPFSSQPTDTDALTIFRSRADAHGSLASNWSTPDACAGRWLGVRCKGGRVTTLSLPSLDLRGPIDPLASLGQLRILDLRTNRLNGTLAALPALTSLRLLYLSRNDLSGGIPPDIDRLSHLARIDLSDNNLRGPIPPSIANLTGLLTLRLQDNLLSSLLTDLPAALPPGLRELNVSNNQIYGRVPDGLRAKFGEASFAGNPGLCGLSPPLTLCSFTPAAGSMSSSPPSASVVPSNPSSIPGGTPSAGGAGGGNTGHSTRGQLSPGAIITIAVGNAVLLLIAASSFLACYCCTKDVEEEEVDAAKEAKMKCARTGGNGENSGGSDGHGAQHQQSMLVYFDGVRRQRRFDLDDLLRASAEMVGRGSLGTVYRAVLEDGSMVAVKRLRDANPCSKREFEGYMRLIGGLIHPNLVPLRAYYYAKQEKLLVYDYLPNGSLHELLHGNRGPGERSPLDWTTRISLSLGAARGLARIHEDHQGSSKIPHGNVKSSNVLLDKNGVARVSDFGLSLLLSPAHVTARLGGYRAPEQAESKRLSQEADVYGFGVLLLEVLTGRAPSPCSPSSPIGGGGNLAEWVRSMVGQEEWTGEVLDAELMRYKNVKEEMVAMLRVGLVCVAPRPERRPKMVEVVKMIEDIRVEQSPVAEDLDESLAATTTDDGHSSC